MKVKNVMSEMPYCCRQTETTRHAAELLKLHGVGSLPVVDNYEQRKLIGMITDREICLQVAGSGRSSDAVLVNDVMSEFPQTCVPDDSIDACESLMEKQQVRQVPVVDEEGRCVGIVSLADIAAHRPGKHIARIVMALSNHIEVASSH